MTSTDALRDVRRILDQHIIRLAEYGRGYPGSTHTATFAREAIGIIDEALDAERARAEALDVKRLRRAVRKLLTRHDWRWTENGRETVGSTNQFVDAIAREYAILEPSDD